jgi:hypothetical protein
LEGNAISWILVLGLSASLLFLTSGALEAQQVEAAAENLVGYWPFNEGSGSTAYDNSGNGNHGTIYGATWVDGISGYALSFDGTDDYVDLAKASLNGVSNWTIEAWIHPLIKDSGHVYSEGAPDVTMVVSLSDGSLYVGTWNLYTTGNWMGYTSREVIIPNEWNFITVTLENGGVATGTLRIYVNGSLVGFGPLQKEYGDRTYFATMGRNVGSTRGGTQTATPFKGIIDEVKIYNRVLSADEILANYRAGVPSATSLSIAPSSFTLNSLESVKLTATLKDSDNNPLADKTVTWAATAGSLSAANTTTDSLGQATVTYTAPGITTEISVTVTASFGGDADYQASSGNFLGKIIENALLIDDMEDVSEWVATAYEGDTSTRQTDSSFVKSGYRSMKITCQFNNGAGFDDGGADRTCPNLEGYSGIGFWSYVPEVKPGHIRVYLRESWQPDVVYTAVFREMDTVGWEYDYVPFSSFVLADWCDPDPNDKLDLDDLLLINITIGDEYSYSSEVDVGYGEYIVYIDDLKAGLGTEKFTISPETSKAGKPAAILPVPIVGVLPFWVIITTAVLVGFGLAGGVAFVKRRLRKPAPPEKPAPKRMLDRALLGYIAEHGGEISIPEASKALGVSQSEVRRALGRLKRAGKVAEE